jgi:hypothetical protein
VFFAYYLESTSAPAQVTPAFRRRLSLVHRSQTDDDPLTEFHNWLNGEITSVLPQSIASNVLRLRGATSAAIGIAVLVAAPAEVALASAAAVGGFVWLATTWSAAATTTVLEGAGAEILNQNPPDTPDFQATTSIIGNGYFEAALNALLDGIIDSLGNEEAGQTAKTIVQTDLNIGQAVDPGNPNGITVQTLNAAAANLFNTANAGIDLSGTWTGSYQTQSTVCANVTDSGQLIFTITGNSQSGFSGSASIEGVNIYETSSCVIEGPASSTSGNVSGTLGQGGSGSASFTLDTSAYPDDYSDSFSFSFQATLSGNTLTGTMTGRTGSFSVTR